MINSHKIVKITNKCIHVSIFSWENGENHILFNIVPPDNGIQSLNTDRAIVAGADFDSWTYRTGFDVALPFLGYFRDENLISFRKHRK